MIYYWEELHIYPILLTCRNYQEISRGDVSGQRHRNRWKRSSISRQINVAIYVWLVWNHQVTVVQIPRGLQMQRVGRDPPSHGEYVRGL